MDANRIEKEANNLPLEIGFKRLSGNAILPTKAHATDSGFDLYAAEDVIIAPGETVVVKTDIAVVLPEGYEAQVRPRSGVTSKTKLRVQLGTIDNSYRGNIGVIVDNIGQIIGSKSGAFTELDGTLTHLMDYEAKYVHTYLVRKGDRIAQLVVVPIPQTVAVEIDGDLTESERGGRGFGSSGTN